ncbi:MAG TPA: amidohydrolase family protein [Dehalococcoidia bacterium]|nr:amidohydrolase family protein [Dehalococcoidia bacterium]
MGYRGYTVIDSDGHVTEPYSLYATYTEEPYRERAQALLAQGQQQDGGVIAVLNELHDRRSWRPRRRLLGAREHWETAADFKMGNNGRHSKARPLAGEDPHQTIQDLDEIGIDVFTGFASRATSLCGVGDAKFEAALVRAFNKWMRDFCAPYPKRLKGVAVLPIIDVDLMIEELERVAKEEWCIGIATMGHYENMLPDHPRWYPLYEAAQRHELPICFHAGGSERPPYTPGREELGDNPWLLHVTGHPWGIQRAMAAAIGGGIYDLFPRLNFVYLEAWCGWLPGWIERLDGEAAKPDLRVSIPKLQRRPSDHLLGLRSFYSFDPGEKLLPMVVREVGAERMVWASDYPHWDCPWDIMLTGVTDRAELTEDQKRLILGENALRLYPRIGSYATITA